MSFITPPSSLPKVDLFTNTSGSWGCAAWHGDSWFQVEWDSRSHPLSIAEKELVPIILACQVWGRSWSGCQVICHCDNQSVVADLRSRSTKHKGMMHLLRCLVFVEAHLQCFLSPTYIDSKANHLADDLSRDDAFSFLSKVPSASAHPSPVSTPLLDLLLDQRADWTSQTWRQPFRDIFRQVWHNPRRRPMVLQ